VCFYLRQSGKQGADAYFASKPAEEPTYRACQLALPLVAAKYPNIGQKVKEASRSPIKGSRLGEILQRPPAQSDSRCPATEVASG
jgi:hypothetical protein